MTERLLFGFIPVYGLLIASGIGIGVYLCSKEEARLGLPKDTAIDFALWAIPLAVIGARLYYVAFTWESFAANPIRILYVWEGGLAIYGGVIGGAIGAWILSRVKHLSFATLADMVAPALILGQAIGRWGNFVNAEAYGNAITNPAWQFFPIAVQIEGVWHQATFFYESLWDLIGFALLYANRKRITVRGNLFLAYLVWYGVGRAIIEGLRTDSLMFSGIRVSQALSVLLALGAGTWMILRIRQSKKNGFTPEAGK